MFYKQFYFTLLKICYAFSEAILLSKREKKYIEFKILPNLYFGNKF